MRKTSVSALLSAALLLPPAPRQEKEEECRRSSRLQLLPAGPLRAPDFCAQTNSKDPAECAPGKKLGFVVHGLWPQNDTTRGPENCAGASPVSQSIVQVMLNYIPTASLIQHEWKTHGTCSGLNVADHFAAVRKARDSVSSPRIQSARRPLDAQPLANRNRLRRRQ